MSQFYNRYIPPTTNPPKQSHTSSETLGKRKRGSTATGTNKVDGLQQEAETKTREKLEHHHGSEQVESNQNPPVVSVNTGKNVLEKYSISHFAKSQDGEINIKPRRRKPKQEMRTNENNTTEKVTSQDASLENNLTTPVTGKEQSDMKHTGVLRRYENSKRDPKFIMNESQERIDDSNGMSISQDSKLYGLEPIPQPENRKPSSDLPSYSTLPAWQAQAIYIEPTRTVMLETLGLSKKMLTNLQSNGIHEAFSIQSYVIPLLLEERESFGNDLCISAATGSGKTFAYVVPVIESLSKDTKSGLRAIIIVPTRELVKQVRDTCEMCAAGSQLRVVTAVGSKSISEEQKMLVEEEELYDLKACEREADKPVDWTTFSLENEIKRAQRRIEHHTAGRKSEYILRTRIKADILITTPGRLVDHLQDTEGFHLDDVRWLIIDEADRLMNESYQEWMTSIMPALRSRRATENLDKILSYMRMALPPRRIRKILLSATMTKDVSKLNRLDLYDPKLIVLKAAANQSSTASTTNMDTADRTPVQPEGDSYSLPPSLSETAIVFKEGLEKPLLLVQLIKKHLGIEITPSTGLDRYSKAATKALSNSKDGSSSSEEESTSSSGSDDSDTESDNPSGTSSPSSQDSNTYKPKVQSVGSRQRQASTPTPSLHRAKALIFTRSTASAARLSRLLSILCPSFASRIATLTRSTASSASSRKALTMFRSGKVQILVATDRASRGIDVPGLHHVVSYDIPGSALTYIHRVGRTARAGRGGSAWTMVEHHEGRWFWNEIGGKGDECKISRSKKVKRLALELDENDDDGLRTRYDQALETLGSEVRGT